MKLNIHFKLDYDPKNEVNIEKRAKEKIEHELGKYLTNMLDIKIDNNAMSSFELPSKNVSSNIVVLNQEEVDRLTKVLSLIKYEYPIQHEINSSIASIT